MSKSRNRRASTKSVYIILAASLILAITYTVWNTYLRPQPQLAGIFLLEQPVVTYGRTNVVGTIRKEFVTPEQASYIIITDEGVAMPLDITGIDHLLGLRVTVDGIRLPIDPSSSLRDVLKVSTISLEVAE